jgi:hypothetical protein
MNSTPDKVKPAEAGYAARQTGFSRFIIYQTPVETGGE